jgi:L,D-peptidoglycan transpeptidase YkuD (ErfK/YbiS/YcfS/YnhG family)
MARLGWLLAAALALPMTTACAHHDPAPASRTWQHAQQMVLVVTPDWDANRGTLRTYERVDTQWREVAAPQPVTIGRAGAAWGLGLHASQPAGPIKREGDGRSPAGVFTIGEAFGYAANVTTALPYAAMQASHYCVDVNGSPLYNRIVDADTVGAAAVAGSTEPMRRDLHADGDQRYRLGFVIDHNLDARPMAGSCIFAHLWKSPADPTAGCTAMDEATMDELLAWLRPDRHPVFVLLPEAEYARLQGNWQLPVIGAPQ